MCFSTAIVHIFWVEVSFEPNIKNKFGAAKVKFINKKVPQMHMKIPAGSRCICTNHS